MRVLDDLHIDEGDGGAMVGLRCDSCRIESVHYWAAPDADYEAVFGHAFGEDLDDEEPDDPDDEEPEHQKPRTARPAAASSAPSTSAGEPASPGYQQAVTRLIADADQVAEYRADLAAFADTLAAKKWGVEVTGPIQDMDGQLVALEGIYRDLAGQVQSQGDQGAAAYDAAPWVPGPDAVLS